MNKKTEVITVKEAKEKLAKMGDDETVSYSLSTQEDGKLKQGSKKELEPLLSAMNDDDELVWGT